ncbi:MAG: hypothetical protein WBA51_08715 [Erythrobacter sp.]
MTKIGIILGSLALISAPVLAQSVPSIAPTSDESALGGESGANVIAAGLIAGIIAIGVLAFTIGDDDDQPISA